MLPMKNVVRILIPTLGALAGTGRVRSRFGKHRDVAHLLDPPVVEDNDVRRVTGRIHGDRQAIVKPGGSVIIITGPNENSQYLLRMKTHKKQVNRLTS